MRKIKRGQMGAYLCIASNDVPPAVSKRIILNVNCEWTLLLLETIQSGERERENVCQQHVQYVRPLMLK